MLTVGALGKRFGLARSTLLYYDAVGLLRPTSRSGAGYRRYDEDAVRRLELVCTLRRAGLSLQAIARALEAPEQGVVAALEERLKDLDAEVRRLQAQQRLIASLLQRPDLLERARVVDKRTWVELLAASGMSEEDMDRWHVAFETSAPEKHQRFLELLGLPPDEVAAIRAWSADGGSQ